MVLVPDLDRRLTPSTEKPTETDKSADKGKFFMPGISGRFREQIEKRKLLWQKKEPEKEDKPQESSSSRNTRVWETVNFAQDQDGTKSILYLRLHKIFLLYKLVIYNSLVNCP